MRPGNWSLRNAVSRDPELEQGVMTWQESIPEKTWTCEEARHQGEVSQRSLDSSARHVLSPVPTLP